MFAKIKQKINFRNGKGQSLVETALIAPIIIFFLIGVFEVGNAVRSYLVLVNVNREITRFAIRPGYLDFSTRDQIDQGYQRVRDWVDVSLAGQLDLDFADAGGNASLIVSHVVVDTALPCEDIQTKPNNCDCEAFLNNPNYNNNYTLDDLIIHPDKSGMAYQAEQYGPLVTQTGTRTTRIDFERLVNEELAPQNNKFNCEIIKKGGVPSANNLIITEVFLDQTQLLGFPMISNYFTDPYPLYSQTTMRLSSSRSTNAIDTIGPVCIAHPFTFGPQVLDDFDNPTPNQNIDAFEGDAPGDFGWLAWNPDEKDTNYVEAELVNPRLSMNDFTNVNDPDDHSLSIGDDVSVKTGVANSSEVDDQLQMLVGQEVLVPVYSQNVGGGAKSYYQVEHFARVRIDQICLPRNGKTCDGQSKKKISATFLGYDDEACTDGNAPPPPPGNNPPVANDDTITVSQDQIITIDVLNNDTDEDGDPLIVTNVTEVSNPFKEAVQVSNGGANVTYRSGNQTGTFVFEYTISDGKGGTDTGTVTITVNAAGVNNPPVAANDSATTDQDTAVTINVISNDSDPDGDTITVSSVGAASNGNVVNNGNGTVTYTPNVGFSGSDSFTYIIDDGNGGTAAATVTVTVNAVVANNPPVANNDSATTYEDTAVTINVGSNDSDPDGDALVFSNFSDPANGSVVYNGVGTVTYTPDPGFSGTDSFTYQIDDGNGGTATATVSVVVDVAPNNLPVANDDSASVDKNNSVTINVLGNDNDPDNDPLTIDSLGTPVAGGSVVDNGNGTVTFTPANNFIGNDSFTYTISDGNGGTATATVVVTVNDIAPPTMHVSSISVDAQKAGWKWKTYWGEADVFVVDENGNKVAGATVQGTWTGPQPGNETEVTNSWQGKAAFETAHTANKKGTYQFCVTSITKDGYTYEPSDNVQTCASDSI
jgi:hypothetical protein